MSYTTAAEDPIWNGVDSDMENGTVNLWLYADSDAVLTSDAPIEILVHRKKYDSYYVDRVRFQLEFDTGVGVRMRLQLGSPIAGAISEYSSDIPVTSDGLLGWHMLTTTWSSAATSDNIAFYLDAVRYNVTTTSDAIPSMTPASSDTFVSGSITGPYRAGVGGEVRTAHLGIGSAAITAANVTTLQQAMVNNTAVGVTVFQGGSGISAIFENPTGGAAYVTKFDVRGKRLRLYQPNTYTRRNEASEDAIGERVLSLDQTYQDAPLSGKDAGDFLISILPQALPRIGRVSFDGSRNAYLQNMAAAVEPGDRIAVTDAYSGFSEAYWVNGVEGKISGPGYQQVTLHVIRAYDVPFWLLGVVGFSELGQTTFLSY